MYNNAEITVVVTPAASYNLIDLVSLRTLLGIPDTSVDAYLNLVIPQASAAAANYANRVFPVETLQDSFWPQRRGRRYQPRRAIQPNDLPLNLSRWPVTAITSVTEAVGGVLPTTLVQDTDFKLDAIRGELLRLDFLGYPTPWVADAIVVTYSAGFATIPADVQMAVAGWIKAVRFAQTRDPALKSENIPGVYSASYLAGASAGSPLGDIACVLDNYRQVLTG